MSEGSASPAMNGFSHQQQQAGEEREASPMAAEEMLGNADSLYPLPPKSVYAPFIDLTEDNKEESRFQPPRVDWIQEDGNWQVFGQTWPIEETLPTLEEMGVTTLYDPNTDRREALHMLLRTALKGYFEMLDALTRPPPSIQARVAGYPDDLDKISHHLRLTAINMHDLVNQLRPVQAKENLIKIVKEEIQDKRDRTRQLQSTIEQVKETLQKLKRYDRQSGTSADMTNDEEPMFPRTKNDSDHQARLLAAVDAIQ